MRRRIANFAFSSLALLAGSAQAAGAELLPVDLDLPSKQDIFLQEVLLGEEGGIARFRFVVPGLSKSTNSLKFADVEADFPVLCERLALGTLDEQKWTGTRIILSMAEEAIEFGATAPQVTQYFEAFSVDGGQCILEIF